MFIFCEIILENNPNIIAAICHGACAIKYCSSSTGTISVSTSHVLIIRGGESLSRAEPPAGPPKLKMLQFSCKQSEISATMIPNAKVGKTSSERTKLEREQYDPWPWESSFSGVSKQKLTSEGSFCNKFQTLILLKEKEKTLMSFPYFSNFFQKN